MREQVLYTHSHTHKNRIIIMYISMCMFLDAKKKDSELNDSWHSLHVIFT